MAGKCTILPNQTTVLTSLPFFVPTPNKTSGLSGLRWEIKQIIRLGTVIYVFQNSEGERRERNKVKTVSVVTENRTFPVIVGEGPSDLCGQNFDRHRSQHPV